MRYAEVAVNAPVAQLQTFTYSIPYNLTVYPGHAVWVPFGPRFVQGIVFKISNESPYDRTRDISETIGDPVLKPHQIQLAQWIAEYYLGSYFNSAALMLPPGFEQKIITLLSAPPDSTSIKLNPDQSKILNYLLGKGTVDINELKKLFGKRKTETTVNHLVHKNLISRTYDIERVRVKPKIKRFVSISKPDIDLHELVKGIRATKQIEILKYLSNNREPLSLTEANAHFSPSTVKTLIVKGLIKITELTEFRDPLLNYHFKETIPPVLTNGQELVWHKIQHALTNPVDKANVYLLHGVTGSGKTEIYIRALQKVVTGGKKGIVLVPEIALTPQTINRFASRFPGKVAVLHSKLSLGERYDEWQLIKEGMFDVVIGSRGAIYAPQPDLGLIIIDEEHEWTYKQQDQSPHYHARDVAIKLAGLTGATVILGSATPDVTTYFHCKNGEYELLQLPERIARENRKGLPEVELVDMRKELKAGNRSIFSNSLSQSISKALFAGEQIILFLNRRGSASFVQCRDCGFVIQCRRCKVSLTYHSAEGDMICHQCNYRIKPAATCPNCLSRRIKYFGIGTQRVAEEAGNTFSGARILRWDRDVTQGKHSHEKILNQFLNHEADILVGTQMIAKGLDLPLVTVVGIISADTALNIPDFRAGERTFQLITQVAGRAGRDLKAGKVIIQTYSPEHYAIDAAARYDYATFYKKELIYRRENNNPPYQRMARLLYSHTNEERCCQESQRVLEHLKGEITSSGLPNINITGPSPAYIERLRGKYRWQIIVRSPDPILLLKNIYLPHGWSIDIDPFGLL